MKLENLEKGHYYHIYNRGINSAAIFKNDGNKHYFLKLANKYLSNKVSILAYCLMNNHYHMVIQVVDDEKSTIQAFSNFLNAYAKAFNKMFNRTGSLFEKHFKRIKIRDNAYLINLIIYIHTNPQYHKLTKDFSTYEFSSYPLFFSKSKSTSLLPINKEEVITLFNDLENMKYVHASKIGLQYFKPDHLGSKDLQDSKDLQGSKNLAGLRQSHDNQMKDKFYNYIQELQDTITSKLEAVDGKAKFREDIWERPEGGGGRTRVIENGSIFEKGGVNISAVYGELPKSMQTYFGVKDANFYACGLSLVLHPKSPLVPTVHANWRYFELYDTNEEIVDQWFGGGQDLTPYYLFEEDATHFHSICKRACDRHNTEFYNRYKKQCDAYFWNAHRNEARGLGGLFFDRLKKIDTMAMQDWYNFVTEVGNSFLDCYIPIVTKRKDLEYTEEQRNWQEIRRGRYVEFNLVHDKGTLFGLKTNGRIESILMSLPPHVQWQYDRQPEEGSEEKRLLEVLKTPKEWI